MHAKHETRNHRSMCFAGIQQRFHTWFELSSCLKRPRATIIWAAINLLKSLNRHRTYLIIMSSLASQIILHPTVSETIKVLNTTLGRDKVRAHKACSAPVSCRIDYSRYIEQFNTMLVFLHGISSHEDINWRLRIGMLWRAILQWPGNVRSIFLFVRSFFVFCGFTNDP